MINLLESEPFRAGKQKNPFVLGGGRGENPEVQRWGKRVRKVVLVFLRNFTQTALAGDGADYICNTN